MFDSGDIPDNFIVKKWVPQLNVLSQASLFITHGGMNSLMESIQKEVPMLVLPCFEDQLLLGPRVSELGIGDTFVNILAANAEQIKSKTYEILNNKKIQSNLHKMREKMEQSLNIFDAVDLIEEFYNKEVF